MTHENAETFNADLGLMGNTPEDEKKLDDLIHDYDNARANLAQAMQEAGNLLLSLALHKSKSTEEEEISTQRYSIAKQKIARFNDEVSRLEHLIEIKSTPLSEEQVERKAA